jgi:ferredoxin-NADP reductase
LTLRYDISYIRYEGDAAYMTREREGKSGPPEDTDNISIVGPVNFKQAIRVEGARRGHTISQAGLEALRLGWPLYLKKVKPRAESVTEDVAA